MHTDVFTELSIVLVIGAIISVFMRLLRQPLIIGYIITGILVGPTLLGFVKEPELIESFGKFGIALLLFIVGLGLNYKVVKEVGRASLFTGIGQVIFTSIIGFLLVKGLGYDSIPALYIAVALTFSSTIIVLKLLNDKKEQNKLYGKISIGFLLVQDVIATLCLVVASTSGKENLNINDLLLLGAKALALIFGMLIFSKLVLKPFAVFLSRSQELLFLFTLSYGFGVAALFKWAGFSLEIGALVAGISMAGLHYAQDVGSKLRPLRDFFVVLFFISLGASLGLSDLSSVFLKALVLSTFVLIGNPLIVMVIMGLMGYTRKTSFKAGLTVAQISEFSIIFILLGYSNKQIDSTVVSMVTLVALITIALSSYMIIYSDQLYRFLERYLVLFERRKVKKEQLNKRLYDSILFGYKRGGSEFIKTFKAMGNKFLVVDYDPDVIDIMNRESIDYLYGDVMDAELLEELDLSKLKLIVITITDFQTNSYLLMLIERINPSCVVICHSDNISEATELYAQGASCVVLPHYIGSDKIGAFIKKSGLKKSEFQKFRKQHIAYLESHFLEEESSES